MTAKALETVSRGEAFLLPIDKPVGLSSQKILYRLRGPLRTKRIGHAGTLDPFASGLLLAGIGKGTRILAHLTELPKEYEGVVALGLTTDTQDPTGKIVRERTVEAIDPARIQAAMNGFLGWIDQIPPMASAIRQGGRRLYEIHRMGEVVERSPRRVRVDSWAMLGVELPRIRFRVRCGKGTYIRTLAHDLGETLGTGAHLAELRRTAIGRHRVEDAIPYDALLAAKDRDDLSPWAISLSDALAHYPSVVVEAETASRLAFGISPTSDEIVEGATSWNVGETIRILSREGLLLALMKVESDPEGERRLSFVSVLRDPAEGS